MTIGLAVAGLGALALLAAWRTRRTWPAWANACALGLRAIALGCAAVLALRPETVRRESHERRPPLVVVVDSSQSLRLRDSEDGLTRAEQGQPALAALLSGAAQRGWEVLSYAAGTRLEPRHNRDETLSATAPASPLGELLAEAAERSSGAVLPAADSKKLPAPSPWDAAGAFVLFSDGCVNQGRPLTAAAGLLAQRGTPLFAVALGQEGLLPPDAWLEELTVRRDEEADAGVEGTHARARVGDRLVVEARAYLDQGSQNLSGPLADTLAKLKWMVPLEEEAGGSGKRAEQGGFVEVEQLRHRLKPVPAWTPVRLRFTPKAAGFYRLRLSLDPLHGERQRANNVAYASVEVLPPQRRVTYSAARLGHHYRRFKELFGSWDGPAVEICADFVKPPPASQSAPADPEWPLERYLAKRLDESVAPGSRGGTLLWEEPELAHLTLKTQARLRAGIETGEWSVVFLLNEPAEEFGRRLRGTPLEDALLFRDFSTPGPDPAPTAAPQPVSSRPAAQRHPATQWAFDARGAEPDPFQVLGPLPVWGPLKTPRPETVVLLAAGPHPLLSVGTAGRGRVALLASGECWRWLNPPKDSYDRRAAFAAEFWKRLVEWASGSSAQSDPPVRLYLPKDRWELGETLSVRVAVGHAVPGEPVKVEYTLSHLPESGRPPAPGPWSALASDTGVSKFSVSGAGSGAAGEGLRVLSGVAGMPQAAGEWLLRVRAVRPNGVEIGQDRTQLTVQGSGLEERSVRPDLAGLQAAVEAAGVSALTGKAGRVLKPEAKEIEGLLAECETLLKPETIWREERVPAVSYPALLVLLVLALVVDVWLRRG